MTTFTWDGETFDFVDRPTVAEFRAILRWLGEDAVSNEEMFGRVAISIKRRRPTFRLEDIDQWPADVVIGIIQEIQKQQVEAAAQAEHAAGRHAADAGEPDPLAGIPEEDLTPTSGSSAPSEPLPPAAATA